MSNDDMIEEAKTAPEGEAVAWRHTLHMENGETIVHVTPFRMHPFGIAGRDFDPGYRVATDPLYDTPPSPDAELVELLTRCSGFIGAHPSGRNLMTAIDAKLTELRKDQP